MLPRHPFPSAPRRPAARAVALTSGLLAVALLGAASRAATAADSATEEAGLRPPAAFASIADRHERSRALFVEAGKVLLHPRCVNCHPSDDTPRQGMDSHPHDPPVVRGATGDGPPAMHCASCHPAANADLARVPGAPHWLLAPRQMAWHGRTLGEICRQLKDRRRNGGRKLKDVVEHVRHDALVGWGWHPGAGRAPAPGSQEALAALIEAWAASGAACPEEAPPPAAATRGAE